MKWIKVSNYLNWLEFYGVFIQTYRIFVVVLKQYTFIVITP